jgi:ethanolaminephosphotransferase
MWIAPNAVTLVGLFIAALGMGNLLFHSPDMATEAPRWVYLLACLSLFIYQLMDAIDGKQARRTNSSSPLGQLFDHGCDSATTTFIALTIATCLQMGFSFRTVHVLANSQVPFWIAQWEEYHTHHMRTCVMGFGVTEIQFYVMFLCLGSGIFGPWIWQIDVGSMVGWSSPILVVDLMYVGACVGVFSITASAAASVMLNSAVNKQKALMQMMPIAMLTICAFLWTSVPQRHPRLLCFTIGVTFTNLTNRMILSAMARIEYPWFDRIIVPMPILYAFSRFGIFTRYSDLMLGAYCSYVVYKTYRYTRDAMEEISEYLGIYVLSIGKRKDD